MHNTHYIRQAANARFQFRGPQCMPHRDDVERLSFEPSSTGDRIPSAFAGYAKELSSLPMLQCSRDCCKKWRRVDGATQSLFGNMTWWKDRRDDEEKQVYELCSEFEYSR